MELEKAKERLKRYLSDIEKMGYKKLPNDEAIDAVLQELDRLQKENEKLGELPYKLIIKIGERQNAFKGKSYIEEAVKYEFEKLIHEIEKLINDLLKEE